MGHSPIPFMGLVRIFTYIGWLIFMVNVGKYTMHGNKFPASDKF